MQDIKTISAELEKFCRCRDAGKIGFAIHEVGPVDGENILQISYSVNPSSGSKGKWLAEILEKWILAKFGVRCRVEHNS